MGNIGGTSWHAHPGIPFEAIMFHLQTDTITPDNTGLTANATFRTGISTQLAPQVAMAIHAIRWNIAMTAHGTPEDQVDQVIALLSEDISATSAAAELTDPRTLAVAGTQHVEHTATAVGELAQLSSYLWAGEFSPPIWTIAQQLRLMGEIVEQASTTASGWDIHINIAYSLHPISDTLRNDLIQRLNLATQP